MKALLNLLFAGLIAFVTLSPAAADEFTLLQSYYAYDATPLNVQRLGSEKSGDVVREEIAFDAFDGEQVRGWLAKPAGVNRPPVVIALHGITQSKQQWWAAGGPYSFPSAHRKALLANGVAVLALDARNHGDRILANDFKNPYAYLEHGYFKSYQKMVAQSVLDVRRAIDFLQGRTDVDSARLGVIGFSMGAHIAWISTAMDGRIKRSLILAMPGDTSGPVDARDFTKPSHYLPGLKGRAVKMLVADKDHFYTVDGMRTLFESIPSTDKKFAVVPSGHDLPPATASHAVSWFGGGVRRF